MDNLAQKGPESAENAANCPYLHREASNKKSYGLEVVMKLFKIQFSLNNPFLKMNSLAYGRYQPEMLPIAPICLGRHQMKKCKG